MQLTVSPEQDGLTLSRLLMQTADVPPWAVKEAIRKRDIRVDGRRIDGDMRVRAGMEIRAYWPKSVVAAQAERELPQPQVVYEDAHVLIVNKPQGLQAQNEDNPLAGDSALSRAVAMLAARGEKTDCVRLCHRLDVQTGGLLLMAKDDSAYASAVQAFAERTFDKRYTCLVKGCPGQREATMQAWLRKDAEASRVSVTDYPARGAQPIVTAYRVLEGGEVSRLEVELVTGRTHQIRAHLAHIGHPILGDDKYGDRQLNRALGVRRQQLWATSLTVHAQGALAYLNGRTFRVDCPF